MATSLSIFLVFLLSVRHGEAMPVLASMGTAVPQFLSADTHTQPNQGAYICVAMSPLCPLDVRSPVNCEHDI